MDFAMQVVEQPVRATAQSSTSREKSLPNTAFPRLRGAVSGRFSTAFQAPPCSFLNLGQAKSLINCAYYSDQYHGRLVIRIDDSGDPKECNTVFENAILQDLEMLGITPDSISHASDHFVHCEQMAEQLIVLGRAYMDVVPDQMSPTDGFNRSCRGRPPAESLHLFRLLCVGHPDGRKFYLRARAGFPSTDTANCGGNTQILRQHDPIIYQHGNSHPHYRTGANFSAYPTPIFSRPIVDAFEGTTHALIAADEDDLFYTWVQRSLGLLPVVVSAFGKVELVDSYPLQQQNSDGIASSPTLVVDTAHLPSLRDLMRRGMSMVPLRAHLLSLGASKRITQIKWDSLWSANRKFLEPLAPRFMAVRSEGCVQMSVARMPPGITSLSVPMHPRNDALGARTLHISDSVILDAQDAQSIEEGEEVTLLRWTSVLVTCIHRNFSRGTMVSLESEYLPVFKFLKKKKAVTWLANCADLVPLRLVQFGPLHILPTNDVDSASSYSQRSTICVDALGDPTLRLLKENDLIQLERLGFFRVDKPYSNSHEPMVLFMIPDGKNKNKHCSIDPYNSAGPMS